MLPEAQSSPVEPPLPPGLVEVGRFASEREAADRGLVVLAMGLGYWVLDTPDGCCLCVEAGVAPDVRLQLALFERENAHWPPRPAPVPPRVRICWVQPLAWACSVAIVFRLQGRAPGRLEAFGALDAGALFGRGEWWRPVTALFLHADLGHLVGNLAAGIFMFGLVLGMLGRVRGALLLAAAAVAGNVAAAALHPARGYMSLGASTAVFAALGLLTGSAVRGVFAGSGAVSLRALLLPALAGLSLLALYGSGGMQTDVIAHGTGFAAGALLGVIGGEDRPAAAP